MKEEKDEGAWCRYALYCSGRQNGRIPIAKCAPRAETGIVENSIAKSTAGNWMAGKCVDRHVRWEIRPVFSGLNAPCIGTCDWT